MMCNFCQRTEPNCSPANTQKPIPNSKAERDILKILEGDCETAIAAHAVLDDNQITLEAELFSLDGSKRFYEKKSSDKSEYNKIGLEIGKILKKKSNGCYKK